VSVVAVDVVVGLAALLSAATGAPPLARRRGRDGRVKHDNIGQLDAGLA